MNRPWMPLHIADYLRDTSHLRALESGAYLHLIMAYWVSGKLPNDDRQLATIAKVKDREWKALRPCMESFFGEGFSSHKRIDKELAKVAEISNKRKAAVEQREIKRRSNDASHDDTPNTSHLTKEVKEEKKEARATRGAALPVDWQPTEEEIGYGQAQGLSLDQIGSAAEEMRLWAAANSNRAIGRKADWSATFKAWMRRNCKQGKPNGQTSANGLSAALRGLKQHIGEIDRGEEGREPPPRLLSHG